jgi:hypothetical protein
MGVSLINDRKCQDTVEIKRNTSITNRPYWLHKSNVLIQEKTTLVSKTHPTQPAARREASLQARCLRRALAKGVHCAQASSSTAAGWVPAAGRSSRWAFGFQKYWFLIEFSGAIN